MWLHGPRIATPAPFRWHTHRGEGLTQDARRTLTMHMAHSLPSPPTHTHWKGEKRDSRPPPDSPGWGHNTRDKTWQPGAATPHDAPFLFISSGRFSLMRRLRLRDCVGKSLPVSLHACRAGCLPKGKTGLRPRTSPPLHPHTEASIPLHGRPP